MDEEKLSKYGYTEVAESDFGTVQDEDKLYRKLMNLFDEFKEKSHWVRAKWDRNRRVLLAQGLGIPLAAGGLEPECFGPLDMKKGGERKPVTSTPILYSTYENLCADATEMVPEAIFHGRGRDDGPLAEDMTAIFSCVLERRRWKETYAKWTSRRSIFGMAVVETMWDETLDGGEGDVDLQVWSPDSIWFDPLCENIQDGRAVFKVTYHHPSWYAEHYPDKIKLMYEASSAFDIDDDIVAVDKATDTIPLVEAWCRRWDAKRKKYTVHMYRLAGGAVLENSEKNPATSGGMYAHGEYPFVVSSIGDILGTPWGMGPIDYLAPVQEYISEMDDMILQNLKASAKPRVIVSKASGLDLQKFANGDQQFIEVNGDVNAAVKWETGQPLNPIALQMYMSKTETLKTESGQNAASRGEVPGSVTAFSAIHALQSASMKRANLSQYNLNASFENVVRQLVSCMMQFYDKERVFRLRGALVETDKLVVYDPAAYKKDGHEWQYDLEIKIQRGSTFHTSYVNQLVMSLIQMGAIDISDAIMLMDVDNKPAVQMAVDKNNRIKQTLQMLMNRVQELEGQQAAAQQENMELMENAEPVEVGAVEMPDMGDNPMFAQANA